MSLKSIDATAVGNTSFKNIQYWTPKYMEPIGEHSLSSTVHAGTLFTARWDAWAKLAFLSNWQCWFLNLPCQESCVYVSLMLLSLLVPS